MCPLFSTICPTRDVGQLPPQHPDRVTSGIRRNLLGRLHPWQSQGPLQKSAVGQGFGDHGWNWP
jgi:hypothetical protein